MYLKRLLAFLCCFTLVFCLFPSSAFATGGNGNIDGGGGGMGQGTSSNFWTPGNDGVRITVVDASSGTAVSSPLDFSNRTQKTSLLHFGKVNKLQYLGGAGLSLQSGVAYSCIRPTQSMPTIVSSKGQSNIEAIKRYFCSEYACMMVAQAAGVDYERMIAGEYKLLIEPIAYFTHNGQYYCMTATEAGLYDQMSGGNLRKTMTSLTHKNLPLSMFLEFSDLGISAWTGNTTGKQNNSDIISTLGVGIVWFDEAPPEGEIESPDVEYRVDTDVITAVTLRTDQDLTPDNPASVTFHILGTTYRVNDIVIPAGDSQVAPGGNDGPGQKGVRNHPRRGQQADPPEAQQAVELVIKLRAHHGQQHNREQDAQQVVTEQQQENQHLEPKKSKKIIPWRRLGSMVAVLALVVCSGIYITVTRFDKNSGTGQTDSVAMTDTQQTVGKAGETGYVDVAALGTMYHPASDYKEVYQTLLKGYQQNWIEEETSAETSYAASGAMNSGSDKYDYSDGAEYGSADADLSEGSKEGGKDYSTTNLQMEGVDESDIAKIDGSYIYTVEDKYIVITDIRDGKLEEVTRFLPKDCDAADRVMEIYVDGDQLILVVQGYETSLDESSKAGSDKENSDKESSDEEIAVSDASEDSAFCYKMNGKSTTQIQVYSIVDRRNPEFEGRLIQDGIMSSHVRMIKGIFR